ncbi:ABC transporter ATP-binding protein [Streptomyces sp. NPDC050263]|uniref:ABC transporter ATP-binding protein n=1 Tax=Streptomyces sp. NPDC050263 TaxID=3155037 RepID=UPI0034181ACE
MPDVVDSSGERIPTVIADSVDIIYRINGTVGGKGSATAALNRIVRRKQADKAAGVRTVHAVKKVSFVAYKGEAIGLIGTNGSGKSTLLKAIAGLQPVERGKIYTEGQPSLLGVNAALMGDLTGERNVYLGGLAMGMTREQIKERYQEIVDFSGINEKGDFISLPMRTYSSGMGARLRFSIAAAKDHDVLLIDEALATGDAKFRNRSAERIQEMREHAGTVFLVSHSNSTITETCERALWLERGELQMDGPAEEVVAAYEAFTSDPKAKKPAAAAK